MWSLDVTWQPVRKALIAYMWTSLLRATQLAMTKQVRSFASILLQTWTFICGNYLNWREGFQKWFNDQSYFYYFGTDGSQIWKVTKAIQILEDLWKGRPTKKKIIEGYTLNENQTQKLLGYIALLFWRFWQTFQRSQQNCFSSTTRADWISWWSHTELAWPKFPHRYHDQRWVTGLVCWPWNKNPTEVFSSLHWWNCSEDWRNVNAM